jgi:DNA-directed RNA polymerase specialized sigma24 family protein
MPHPVPIASIPTEDLLRRCAGSAHGHNQAWEVFIHRYEPAVRSGVRQGWFLAKSRRPQTADVDDLVQEVYCHLLAEGRRRLRRCRHRGGRRMGAFLYRMAVRVVLDQHRMENAQRRGGGSWSHHAKSVRWIDEFPAPAGCSDPRLPLERREALRCAFRRHVEGRPQRRRDLQIWLLATAAGFRCREIAAAMPGRLSENQVSKALQRVRHTLSTMGEGLESLL